MQFPCVTFLTFPTVGVAARLTERDSRLTHYFALFWGLRLRLGDLPTSGAKSDVIFLLGDPNFL